MNADVGIFLAVGNQRGRELDVAVIKVGKLGFPVGVRLGRRSKDLSMTGEDMVTERILTLLL